MSYSVAHRFERAHAGNQRDERIASRASRSCAHAEAPDTAIMTWADSAKVQRALNNLVDNACKFTPAGGRVDITLRCEDGHAILSVADSGIGIPTDDLPQLFNRFPRGRNATAVTGSGLGLAIVKAIVEQQSGQIAVENRSPGARFSMRWPCID